MLAKILIVAALAAVVAASIPIITPALSLPQRLAAARSSVSKLECVPCADAMSEAIHEGFESGLSMACRQALLSHAPPPPYRLDGHVDGQNLPVLPPPLPPLPFPLRTRLGTAGVKRDLPSHL